MHRIRSDIDESKTFTHPDWLRVPGVWESRHGRRIPGGVSRLSRPTGRDEPGVGEAMSARTARAMLVKCPHCPRRFDSLEASRSHVEAEHRGEP